MPELTTLSADRRDEVYLPYGALMSMWSWIGVAVGVALVLYVAFVLVLLLLGRRTDARAWAGLVPDYIVLFARLLKDPAFGVDTRSCSRRSSPTSPCL